MPVVDVFWSFRSPYSYLATQRLIDIMHKYDVRVRPRPVYPIAVRKPEFFEDAAPQWLPYLLKDIGRVSEYLGIDLSMPSPDPIVQDMETRKIAEHQPYIKRLTQMGVLAAEAGDDKGWAFLKEVSSLIWSGKPWLEGTAFSDAVAKAGFDLAELEQRIVDEHDRLEEVIAENEAEHDQYHWGVPLMVFDGEAFYGQDRIDMLVWTLEKAGVRIKA